MCIVNNTDITLNFIDSFYLDFEIISTLSDVQMQESFMLLGRIPGNRPGQHLTAVPAYSYTAADPITIALDLNLYYKWGDNLIAAPRFYISIYRDNNLLFKTQYGVFDSLNIMNQFSNTYLIKVQQNNKIAVLLSKFPEADNTFTLFENSFMKITQV